MATITTVIPVYNGEKYIAETLMSLAAQTRKPDRVVIVDDCSNDGTEKIVREFRGIRCEWAPNPKNIGLFPNHNSAIRFAAETEYFHILHANDLISPQFFERLIPLIQNAPGFAMAYCGHVFIREDGAETEQRGSIGGLHARKLSLRDFLITQGELKAIQLHSAVLKTSFKPLPVSFPTDFPQSGDVVFHAQFATHCSEIWATPEILSLVRVHQGSASSKNSRNLQAWVLDEWRTMELVHGILRENALAKPFDASKSKLLFAARAHVKANMVKSSDPGYAREIETVVRQRTGTLVWSLAGAVVTARDILKPQASAYKDVIAVSKKETK